MIQLDKKTTKLLEHESTPISNVLYRSNSELSDDESEAVMFRSFDLTGWAHNGRYYNFPDSRSLVNVALHKQVAAMSEVLGFKPNYHIVWSIRNAVWGLQIDDLKLILYISTEGTSIQIEPTCNDADARRIIDHLHNLLITIPPYVTPLNKGYK